MSLDFVYINFMVYNLVYKIIANFISNIIKPVLVKFISKEQFNFLSNRKIMDSIRVSQECLHSIKIKKIKDLILNMDLVKAYDRMDKVYLILFLLQIGMPLVKIYWMLWRNIRPKSTCLGS